MAIIIEQIDNDFLSNYLTSSANFSANENMVICDSQDNILYATEKFLSSFANEYQVGDKFVDYKTPLHLSVIEDPIYSRFSGLLLCVKYKFKSLYTTTVLTPIDDNQKSINFTSIDKLKTKLSHLSYTLADLNTLLINILCSNIVISKNTHNQLKFFDKQDNLIYESPIACDDNLLLNHINVRKILSMTSGEYVGRVEEHSFLFKNEVSYIDQ